MKNKLVVFFIAFCALFSFADELMGKGGSRSSSSRSSSSRSSGGKSSSGWGKSKPSTSSNKSKSTPSKTFKSSADKAAYQKATKNGTAFKTRDAAAKDFKAKNGGKYKSTYSKEPTKRPEHIPSSTKGADGATYNVTYNQGQGGYGYTNALGTFIMYDMMTDAVMMNSMMRNQGYYHGSPYTASSGGGSAAGIVFGWIFGTILFVVVVGFVCLIVFRS